MNILVKNVNSIIFTGNTYIWAKYFNTLSFMLMLTFFSQIFTKCHNDGNVIKPGSNSKMTDKYAAEA